MYQWSGPYAKGMMRERRIMKRREADQRNAETLPERRRAFRRAQESPAKKGAHTRWITSAHKREMKRKEAE